jgi:EAL domain-containing protein (putative c-di-GMP-specific phosphodiesterase class I)
VRTDLFHTSMTDDLAASLGTAPDPRIARVLRDSASIRAVQPVFQPIVNLATGVVVGAEALARWPDSPGVDPSAVIDAARTRHLVHEVDSACRNAALHAASVRGHLDDGLTVFINVEPDALVEGHQAGTIFVAPTRGVRVILELTERALLDNPAQLLAAVLDARARGLGIALDDVGQNPDSLTLLSLIAPDVVKLDRTLTADAPNHEQLRVIAAVNAYAEATGATILAEGIETADHHRRAVSFGATLGQGWLIGKPAALPPTPWPPLHTRDRILIDPDRSRTPNKPSDLIGSRAQIVDKPVVVGYSRYLEEEASTSIEPLTVLASFQHTRHFTSDDATRYRTLARHPLVAVIGVDVPAAPAPGVRGTSISVDHPLTDEWTVVLLGRHVFAALLAREVHNTDTDTDCDPPVGRRRRRFAYTLTYDRATVTAAGRALLHYMNRA